MELSFNQSISTTVYSIFTLGLHPSNKVSSPGQSLGSPFWHTLVRIVEPNPHVTEQSLTAPHGPQDGQGPLSQDTVSSESPKHPPLPAKPPDKKT
ncbi:unnamed protein product [Clavelina lepadiformis]|uniref:Uncharacterized protein n=1 Tax=Clavelina lepadiformis TaxID=159417 RepID=A0ABP0F8M0_CLALP